MFFKSASSTIPSPSWSMSENASLNCCICCVWKSENTPRHHSRLKLAKPLPSNNLLHTRRLTSRPRLGLLCRRTQKPRLVRRPRGSHITASSRHSELSKYQCVEYRVNLNEYAQSVVDANSAANLDNSNRGVSGSTLDLDWII